MLVAKEQNGVSAVQKIGNNGSKAKTWKQLCNEIGNLTGSEAAALCEGLAESLGELGDVTLKQAVVLNAFNALVSAPVPDSKLLGLIMDRDEGKVPNANVTATIDIDVKDWRTIAQELNVDPQTVLEEFRRRELESGGERDTTSAESSAGETGA